MRSEESLSQLNDSSQVGGLLSHFRRQCVDIIFIISIIILVFVGLSFLNEYREKRFTKYINNQKLTAIERGKRWRAFDNSYIWDWNFEKLV